MLPPIMCLFSAAGARPRIRSRWGRVVATLALALAVLALTGCGLPWSSPTIAPDPGGRRTELAEAGGRPCPRDLPIGDDPSGHGFGTEEVADGQPALLEPLEAWVCQYNTVEVGTAPSGGVRYGWRRVDRPVPVAARDLPDLRDALGDLAPADRGRACTADLGPRWMVAYTHDGDLTGVVVDDYGCRDVRLSDDPHTTPPGADGQEGTVGGVLDGGVAILEVVGVGRSE